MSWSCTGGSGKNQEPGTGGRGPGTRDRGPGAKRRGPGAGGLVLIVDVMASRARGLVACEGRAGDMACLRA